MLVGKWKCGVFEKVEGMFFYKLISGRIVASLLIFFHHLRHFRHLRLTLEDTECYS